MHPTSVVISGASGFLGSHIAEAFSSINYKVLALVRNSTDLWRLNEIQNENIVLINIDQPKYKESLHIFKPTIFVHAAWKGVSAISRNDWAIQTENVDFTVGMLTLADELKVEKFITLGSQAEYGIFDGRIKETSPCNPNSAYGAAKTATSLIVKSFCETHAINWIWLRLFSIYGKRENEEWLIPSVIKRIMQKIPVDLTGCEQRYDYLYADDFAKAVVRTAEQQTDSGYFNLSSNSSIRLKDLIEEIRKILNPKAVLNFGALPYRPNQVMHMEGDSTSFNDNFKLSLKTDFESDLNKVVNYYKSRFTNSI